MTIILIRTILRYFLNFMSTKSYRTNVRTDTFFPQSRHIYLSSQSREIRSGKRMGQKKPTSVVTHRSLLEILHAAVQEDLGAELHRDIAVGVLEERPRLWGRSGFRGGALLLVDLRDHREGIVLVEATFRAGETGRRNLAQPALYILVVRPKRTRQVYVNESRV